MLYAIAAEWAGRWLQVTMLHSILTVGCHVIASESTYILPTVTKVNLKSYVKFSKIQATWK